MNQDFFIFIIRNINFRFEFVHLKIETSSLLDVVDFILQYLSIQGFSVNQGHLKVNEPARGGLKPLHSILSLDGKYRFQIK